MKNYLFYLNQNIKMVVLLSMTYNFYKYSNI